MAVVRVYRDSAGNIQDRDSKLGGLWRWELVLSEGKREGTGMCLTGVLDVGRAVVWDLGSCSGLPGYLPVYGNPNLGHVIVVGKFGGGQTVGYIQHASLLEQWVRRVVLYLCRDESKQA